MVGGHVTGRGQQRVPNVLRDCANTTLAFASRPIEHITSRSTPISVEETACLRSIDRLPLGEECVGRSSHRCVNQRYPHVPPQEAG